MGAGGFFVGGDGRGWEFRGGMGIDGGGCPWKADPASPHFPDDLFLQPHSGPLDVCRVYSQTLNFMKKTLQNLVLLAIFVFFYSLPLTSKAQILTQDIPAVGETTPAAPDSDRYKSEVEAATVTIEYNISDRASGATGFVAEFQGKKYVVTNIHVLHGEASSEAGMIWSEGAKDTLGMTGRKPHLSRLKTSYQEFQKLLAGSPLPKIKNQNGEELKLGRSLLLSISRDIALIPVDTEMTPLQISTSPPKRDENIFGFGNPEAEHSICPYDGSIKASGPDRLELKMESNVLKPGMSGAPVVNSVTGKVIGLITYSVKKPTITDNKFRIEDIRVESGSDTIRGSRVTYNLELVTRNFAYRIDNLTDLQPISWPQFLLDCGTLQAMKERTDNVLMACKIAHMYCSSGYTYEISPDFDSSVAMACSSALKDFKVKRNIDFQKCWDSYHSSLETLLNQDFASPKNRIQTAYIRNLAREVDISPDRQKLASFLRLSAGKMPSRAER
jgi:hypothetical protein